MKAPLTYSTLAESVSWLCDVTGKPWTENELLDCAACNGLTLGAVPPIDAKVNVCELDLRPGDSDPFRVKHTVAWRMGLLYPFQVGQIMLTGETETAHAAPGMENRDPPLYFFFSEPVRVTRENVRVPRSVIQELAAKLRSHGTAAPTEAATLRSSAPAKPERETQADRIRKVLTDCESRAAAANLAFERERMPGQKADFLELLHALDSEMRSIKKIDSLDRYLKDADCKWPLDASAQPSAAPLYARLFPEAHIRAPGVVSPQRRKA